MVLPFMRIKVRAPSPSFGDLGRGDDELTTTKNDDRIRALVCYSSWTEKHTSSQVQRQEGRSGREEGQDGRD